MVIMSVDFVTAVSSSSVLFVILDGLKALALDLQRHVVLLIAHKSHHKTALRSFSRERSDVFAIRKLNELLRTIS